MEKLIRRSVYLKVGDLVEYKDEKYIVLWVYDQENIEIKTLKKSINQVIPVKVSELNQRT